MEFEILTAEEIRVEVNTNAYLRNLILKGDEQGDYTIYQSRLKETYIKLNPLRDVLIKACEELRDVTGTKGTAKLRKIIMALGGFK